MRTTDESNFMQHGSISASGSTAVGRDALTRYLATYLDVRRFKDVAPNGLQVEGTTLIHKMVVGVTANQLLIDAAIDAQADAIVVHHGLFWKGDDPRIVGFHKQRIARLIAHNINLYAYHLPLDAHAEVGNNVQLAKKLGLNIMGAAGEGDLVLLGQLGQGIPLKSAVLAAFCGRHFGNRVAMYTTSTGLVQKIAWCTGAGGSLLRDAIDAGAEAFITGEIAEHHIHVARESNVTLITIGHHASERGGPAALGMHLTQKFNLVTQFIDVDSPL
ncbi:MAG: Nif3-like dinuclear metal center hexameric protein [Casimicrobium sp.]